MIFDLLFEAVKARLLTTVAEDATPVKLVDWFNDQPDKIEAGTIDGFTMPAALIRFEPPNWIAFGRKTYRADAIIYVDVLQPAVDRLVSDAVPAERARATTVLENVQSVALALNALGGDGFSAFKLVMMEPDHAYTNLRVDTLGFQTNLFTSMDPRTWMRVTPELKDTYKIVPTVPVEH